MRTLGHRRGTPSTASIHTLLLPRRPWVKFLRPLLPSFIADAIFPDYRHPWRLHATSYLDGLRGIACLLVFFCHYTENQFPALIPSYTHIAPYPPVNITTTATTTATAKATATLAAVVTRAAAATAATVATATGGGAAAAAAAAATLHNTTLSLNGTQAALGPSVIQLPFLRVIFSGRPMVHIFFVISGFVLAYKPVRALHARDTERCYAALASSTFRRAFRLFGPCVVSTFLVLCLRQMGYLLPAQETWAAEFWKWKGAVLRQITWPWDWDRDLRPAYDIHLWTIPIEFAHSMLLFMVLLMLSRVRLPIRMGAVFGLMVYCLTCGKWAGFEFLAGLFLAELHVLRAARAKDRAESSGMYGPRDSAALEWPLKALQVGLVLLGLFIAGWPNKDADKTPGIRYFLWQTPLPFAKMDPFAPQKFWFGLSAVATVWSVGDLDFLRGFFDTPFAQYLGRISYAVYICHGPVEGLFKDWLIGHPPIAASGEPGALNYKPAQPARGVKGFIGTETTAQITMSWFVGLWLLGPIVIWAADIFWRAVDSQIVSLARRLETLCLDDTEPSPRSQGYSVAA